MAGKYYIDANALLAEAKRLAGPETGDGWSNMGLYALIERQPAADVRPVKRGHWIECLGHYFPFSCGYSVCSECRVKAEWSTRFCPNCGAEMREES